MCDQQNDFRATRIKLKPDDFALSSGKNLPPTDIVPERIWKSITSLPDDVSLRTSEYYGSCLDRVWNLWGCWISLVIGLQESVADLRNSPITHTACDAGDYFQASIYNALIGHYRLAFTSLRGVVENLTIGIHFELANESHTFKDWLGGEEFSFGQAADLASQHKNVCTLEKALQASGNDDLFHQRRPPADQGGLMRRLFRILSKYAHGAPGFTDGDIWQSNGPIFVSSAFESWYQTFLIVYGVGTVLTHLARPCLDEIPLDCPHNVRNLLADAVDNLPSESPERRLFDKIIDDLW